MSILLPSSHHITTMHVIDHMEWPMTMDTNYISLIVALLTGMDSVTILTILKLSPTDRLSFL